MATLEYFGKCFSSQHFKFCVLAFCCLSFLFPIAVIAEPTTQSVNQQNHKVSDHRPEFVAESSYAQVQVVTSHFKPYSYMQNNKPVGYSVEQVNKIFAQLNFNPDINVGKWKHVYDRALKRPNVLIFSLLRTPERENKFHWVGQIGEMETYLFRKKGNTDIEVGDLNDGLQYITGAIEKDAKGKYLVSHGYKPFPINNQVSGIKMLMHGRLDLIIGDKRSLQHDLKELGYPEDTLEPVLKLKEVSKPIYLAFSKDTPTKLVGEFQTAYKKAFKRNAD